MFTVSAVLKRRAENKRSHALGKFQGTVADIAKKFFAMRVVFKN
jgi:hypothetical protein